MSKGATTLLVVLTMAVLSLYGAGLRRPFGSVRTVIHLPLRLRQADHVVLAADLIFAAFILGMWGIIFYSAASIWYPALLGFALLGFNDALARRLDLEKSFWVSIGLALFAVVLGAWVLTGHDVVLYPAPDTAAKATTIG